MRGWKISGSSCGRKSTLKVLFLDALSNVNPLPLCAHRLGALGRGTACCLLAPLVATVIACVSWHPYSIFNSVFSVVEAGGLC